MINYIMSIHILSRKHNNRTAVTQKGSGSLYSNNQGTKQTKCANTLKNNPTPFFQKSYRNLYSYRRRYFIEKQAPDVVRLPDFKSSEYTSSLKAKKSLNCDISQNGMVQNCGGNCGKKNFVVTKHEKYLSASDYTSIRKAKSENCQMPNITMNRKCTTT